MNHSRPDIPLGAAIQEIADAFGRMAKSEIQLAKAEARHAFSDFGRHIAMAVFFGVIALASALPLLAFAVIGLGRLLDDNYWLSSLIVGIVMLSVGGFFAYRYYRETRKDDLSLPNARESLRQERSILQHKLRDISEVTKRRAS